MWLAVLIGVASAGLLVFAYRLNEKTKAEHERILQEKGITVKGWIIQANDVLYEPGHDDRASLILFSHPGAGGAPDPVLIDLAQKVFALRSTARTPLEHAVAEVALDEAFVDAKNGQFPFEFTSGKNVYWLHICIRRKHLPGGFLKVPYVQLRVARVGDKVYYKHIDYLDPAALEQASTAAG